MKSVGPVGTSDIDRRAALQAMVAVTGLPVLASSSPPSSPSRSIGRSSSSRWSAPAAPRPIPTCCIPRRTGPGFPRRAGHARGAGGHDHPADAKSPSASAVGVPAWINEYVSAPYDGQMRDLIRVQGGLAWLNVERRFGLSSSAAERADLRRYLLSAQGQAGIPVGGARFFDLVRDLTAVGFYTTDAGCATSVHREHGAAEVGPPPKSSSIWGWRSQVSSER